MMLSEKIMTLRKKKGWSQEELAEKLDVSRQSVSKWESAASVPDLERILQISPVQVKRGERGDKADGGGLGPRREGEQDSQRPRPQFRLRVPAHPFHQFPHDKQA